ncbi:hypothetical protein [Paraflavitalea sp. CAU 1676]|uniref:hypothetical protein n=1 Tax=Paraflavitalea sp. CAU 1676 TaxID=3032598 RepID=UPI0023DC652E|nr:hypothetical protein [Paraflavitalea sp. CAU 1676]MDF2193665.1 hypothetical protein [Paraflavitalea sp. CAU 1676]
MSRLVRYIIAGICLFTFSGSADAQVLVKAFIDRDKIVVGDSVVLTLDVRAPLGQSITWFNLDTIPHFEFLAKGKIDTLDGVDGKKWIQQVVITSYDSGYWQIPMLPVTVEGKHYFSDSLSVQVGYANTDLSQEYKDIKEIEEVANTETNYIPWIIGAVTLVALGVMLALFLRKKKKIEAPPVVAIALTPYDEALAALEKLKKEDLPGKGEVKKYYTALNDILRTYVHRKMNISSAEKTNEELIVDLRRAPMQPEYFKELTNALRMTDFVKFARYEPNAEDNEKNFGIIESTIKTLNNIA